MARRSEHSREEIKEMILLAAEGIVQEFGFSALKVRKIAADIGYTVGSIYMVFSGMDDLIMHVKARTWKKLGSYLQTSMAGSDTQKTVEDMLLAYLDFVTANEGGWRMLFEHQLPVGKVTPEWYLQSQEAVLLLVNQQVKQINSSNSDLKVNQLTRVVMNSIQGLSMQLLVIGLSEKNISSAKQDIVLLAGCFVSECQKVEP